MSRIRVPKFVLSAAMMALAGSIAFAVPVKDQYQEAFSGADMVGNVPPYEIVGAQTFIPSISGLLDSVELHSVHFWGAGSGIAVSILQTSGGIPTGAPIGSAVGLNSGFKFDDWNAIDLSAQNIYLTAGVTYALMVDVVADNGYIFWDTDFWVPGLISDPYTSGGYYVNENNAGWVLKNLNTAQDPVYLDAMFRTYMDPDVLQGATIPEPMTLLLLGLGCAGMVVRKGGRSK